MLAQGRGKWAVFQKPKLTYMDPALLFAHQNTPLFCALPFQF